MIKQKRLKQKLDWTRNGNNDERIAKRSRATSQRSNGIKKKRFRALEKEIENELGINMSLPLSPRLPKGDT